MASSSSSSKLAPFLLLLVTITMEWPRTVWVLKHQHGVLQGAMQATWHCKQHWITHVVLVLIVSLFSPMASVYSQTHSKLMLLMPSTVTIRKKPEHLVLVILLALPPLPKVTPAMDLVSTHLLLGAKKIARIRENSNFFRSELKKMGFEVRGDNDAPVMSIMLYNPAKLPAFSRECLNLILMSKKCDHF